MPTPTALVWRSEKPAAEIQYHCLEIGGASGQSGGSRMKKPCDCCRRYLDHLDAKNQNMICFLRCMTANSKHSTKIHLSCVNGWPSEMSAFYMSRQHLCTRIYSPRVCQLWCSKISTPVSRSVKLQVDTTEGCWNIYYPGPATLPPGPIVTEWK
ncbi:uncharacterized protein LOC133911159 isoform X2 [Phragmites australis]|uniref:uncharacterized protein LOC133911159 isoform X2 n=1 Tax=Phragmites australis TaxID=29695 RepID=UPI002D77F6FC|nr:uncharacterized protein LOC133911159 isoform X2 [Phragmites australis]